MEQVEFMRDPATERWLDTFSGVIDGWTYAEAIPMAHVDQKASRANQARREPIDPANLEKVLFELQHGECPYPVVLRRIRPDRLVVISGNHRDEAYRKLKLGEISAYVVECSEDVAHLMASSANMVHGKAADWAMIRAEIVRARDRGVQAKHLATVFRMSEGRIGEIHRAETGRRRMREIASVTDVTSTTKLDALNRLDDDDLRTLGEAAARRSIKDIETAATRLNATKDAASREQLRHEIVGEWRVEDKQAQKPAITPRERKAKAMVDRLVKPLDLDLVSVMTPKQMQAVLDTLDERLTEMSLLESQLRSALGVSRVA